MERCGFVIYKNYLITIGGHDGIYLDMVCCLDLDDDSDGWKIIKHIKAPGKKTYFAVMTMDNYIYIL